MPWAVSDQLEQVGLRVDQLLQAAAVVQPVQRQAGRQAQLGEPEARPVRDPGR